MTPKLPKFLIAYNPMVNDDVFIYHTRPPRFLAKRVYDNPLSDFEIVQDIDNMAAFYSGDLLKVAGLMRRMGDWFVAYNVHLKNANNENI